MAPKEEGEAGGLEKIPLLPEGRRRARVVDQGEDAGGRRRELQGGGPIGLRTRKSTRRHWCSAETILEICVSCIMIHEISFITYSKHESIHGVYRFFSMQPITKKAKMKQS